MQSDSAQHVVWLTNAATIEEVNEAITDQKQHMHEGDFIFAVQLVNSFQV